MGSAAKCHLTGDIHFFDLEDPHDAARLAERGLALRHLTGTVILDEIQDAAGSFRLLRVPYDRRSLTAPKIVLGSASIELLKQSSESLAGRLTRVEPSGFFLEEVFAFDEESLWHRVGEGFLHLTSPKQTSEALDGLEKLQRAYLTFDLDQVDTKLPLATLARF